MNIVLERDDLIPQEPDPERPAVIVHDVVNVLADPEHRREPRFPRSARADDLDHDSKIGRIDPHHSGTAADALTQRDHRAGCPARPQVLRPIFAERFRLVRQIVSDSAISARPRRERFEPGELNVNLMRPGSAGETNRGSVEARGEPEPGSGPVPHIIQRIRGEPARERARAANLDRLPVVKIAAETVTPRNFNERRVERVDFERRSPRDTPPRARDTDPEPRNMII